MTEDTNSVDSYREAADIVREYRTPPGERLYAYQEGNEHVVVSNGKEPHDNWTKRIPAELNRPIPGQKRWTIPSNWKPIVKSKRDSIAYGIYYIPETDIYVKTSIPTNNWLVDAWYGIKSVGDITADTVGELSPSHEARSTVRDIAKKYETEYGADRDAEVLRQIASNWGMFEEEVEHGLEWVADEGLDQTRPTDQPLVLRDDWTVEFQERVIRPRDAINRELDICEVRDAELPVLIDELKEADLLPNEWKFTVALDESPIGTEYYIRGMIELGASVGEALDYVMVEINGMDETEWASERGTDGGWVRDNIFEAEKQLSK